MVDREVTVNIKEEPSQIKSIAIGFSTKNFLLAFNCDEEGVPEKAFTIEPEELSEIISALFQSGVTYQKENGVDIGFGMVNEYEE